MAPFGVCLRVWTSQKCPFAPLAGDHANATSHDKNPDIHL